MSPFEYRILINIENETALSDYFMSLGAVAITEKPVESLRDEREYQSQLVVLFNDEAIVETMNAVLPILQSQALINGYEFYQHDASINWVAESQKEFAPISIGKRLYITSDLHALPHENRKTILLNPGSAFGTGTHPTTYLCLQWLEENIRGGESVIDYGCGTGVLSLAALKLGAKQVIAVDIDEMAIQATEANAILNDISREQLIVGKSLPTLSNQVDIIICNIIINPLVTFANKFATHLKSTGVLVLSGMLVEQVDEVVDAFSSQFQLISHEHLGEWACVIMQRRIF